MTELEQRLTNELSKLAGQYAEDQKRLAGQVEHLEEQVRGLAENYGQAVSSFKALENATQLLRKDHQKMGAHITKLTNAYDAQTKEYEVFVEAFNSLAVDLNELFR